MDSNLFAAAITVSLLILDLLSIGHGAESRDGFTR